MLRLKVISVAICDANEEEITLICVANLYHFLWKFDPDQQNDLIVEYCVVPYSYVLKHALTNFFWP